MSIQFQCPHCQAEHTAADFTAGRRIRCPSCDMIIEVPRPADALPSGSATPTASDRWKSADAEESAPGIGDEPAPPIAEEPSSSDVLPKTKFSPKRRMADGELDMTPMVDVVFNLLIFFMVTASFVQQRSLEVPKPEKSDEASTQVVAIEDNPEYVTVLVDEYNTFHISTVDWERECAGEQELLNQLREARAVGSDPPTKLLVKAHVDATHEYVVMALDAGTAVGIEEVQMATVEESL